jgi:serine phosphatase RsbU (regulator of sigma subunit)
VLGAVNLDTHWLHMPLAVLSGDYADGLGKDDAAWFILADAMGHGYLAHAVVEKVRRLWEEFFHTAVADQAMPGAKPSQILEHIDKRLEPYVPEDDVFVEAAIVRIDSSVQMKVAGICRLVFRPSSAGFATLQFVKDFPIGIRHLLGALASQRVDEEFELDIGDEVAFASDGLLEHPYKKGRLRPVLEKELRKGRTKAQLHDRLIGVLEDAGKHCEPDDDITIVTVCCSR